ncbi:phage terminase small subunit [Rhodoblastus acidophilus]|uniref:terminase small subunit n=1 Tax=Rhodoblastus acidophilus TaxID=1074 RepID=UPI002224A1CE|nr:terminase small subunit [Rhodoblastus acidophilus]MCW2284939.1 phage terminase small subunit [Rhodoblastus acidophilus]MCW2333997.1 phage terminase small subunit [Rhodoblastus acidophilus]
MKPSKKLTPKQQRFVEEYIISLNATKAALEAGYSAKTAKSQGQRLLTNVDIADAISAAKKSRSERTEITADRVLHELAAIAFLDPAKVFTPTGEVRSLEDMDESVRRAIASVETISSSDGDAISTVRKVRMNDKLRALELLGKHLQLWVERVKLGGEQENPLHLIVQQMMGNALPVRP